MPLAPRHNRLERRGRRSAGPFGFPVPEAPILLLTLALLAAPDTAVGHDKAIVRDVAVAPGETLRTTSIGTGRPLVLIPGVFGAAFGFRAITGPLVARGYRCIVVEPLGYGWSSHPKEADYSFTAQAARIGRALDSLGVRGALFAAQSSGAAIAFRVAVARPDLVRGLLSIDGGPAESAATAGMRKAFRFGGGLVKLAMNEQKLRHDVRREIILNSGDTTWVTKAVIREYTAGQAADMHGSIDAFHQMSSSKEPESLASRLHQVEVPVRLMVGTVPHPSEVTPQQRELLRARLPDFAIYRVVGSGQYIPEERPAMVVAAVGRLADAAR